MNIEEIGNKIDELENEIECTMEYLDGWISRYTQEWVKKHVIGMYVKVGDEICVLMSIPENIDGQYCPTVGNCIVDWPGVYVRCGKKTWIEGINNVKAC